MIVGEAPGKSGRSIIEDGLKPSFIFEKTSFILRRAIFDSGDLFQTFPYITNLCKYAAENNKIKDEDFDKCYDIFLKEIELLNPSKIIVLGNNAFDYLMKKLPRNLKWLLVKQPHPSSILYNGGTQRDYSQKLKNILYEQ